MKNILIFTTKEGHLSIATAASEALQKANFKVKVMNTIATKGLAFYTPFYRYFPFLFQIPYKIGKQKQIQKGVKILTGKLLIKEVKNAIKKNNPDLIISTNLFYNSAISQFLDYQKNPIPFINIIANPWAIHPLELSSSADFNLVYDEKGVKIGRKNKISSEKLLAVGWPVRQKFYQKYDLVKIRKQYGFKKDIFTLLICGGSEGANMILKILPALFMINKPIQVAVVCGTNKTLYKTASSFKTIIPRLTKINGLRKLNNLNLKLFRFTDQLPQLMNIADLVVGKAGPNFLFETVAAKKPFLAICHISGQEDANLDLIRKKKLGFIEENPFKAIKLLKTIIKKPEILNQFQKSIEKEKNYNQKTSVNLVKVVSSLLAN